MTVATVNTSVVLYTDSGAGVHDCTGANILWAYVLRVSSTIDAPTFDGVAMTAATGDGLWTDSPWKASLFYMLNPPSGSKTFVTHSDAQAHLVSQSGADVGGTPFGTIVGATGTSTAPSVNVTGATDCQILDFMSVLGSVPTATVGSGQTDLLDTAYAGITRTVVSRETGTGTITMDWSLSASQWWHTIAVPVLPVAAASSAVPVMQNYYNHRSRS